MFLTDRKLERRISELQEYRYRDVKHLESFVVAEETQGVVNPELPKSFEGWDELCVGDTWKGRDRFLWMHREIEIPAEWTGKKVLGIFDYGNTGAGNNSGFESMFYLNGEMYQGVDANHKEVFFKEEHCGKVLDVTFRLWSGLEGGGVPTPQEHKIARADLAWLDEQVDDLYYMAMMVWETIKELNEYDPKFKELMPEKYWDAVKVDGRIYGIPSYKDSSISNYSIWDKELVDEYSIEYQNLTKLEDLTPIFEELKADKNDYPVYIKNDGIYSIFDPYDQIGGGTQIMGVRYDDQDAKVCFTLEEPEVYSALETFHDWYKKGIINPDAATLTEGRVYNMWRIAQGWESAGKTSWGPQMGKEVVVQKWGETILSNETVRGGMNMISANSKYPEKCLEFLNLVNTDTTLRDMFYYGEEGVNFDYVDVDGKQMVHKINEEWPMAGYTQGTFFTVTPVETDTEGQWDEIKALNEEAVPSVMLGFNFDSTEVESQLANCREIWLRYRSEVMTGVNDPKEVIPKIKEELDKAGFQDVLDAAQTQVDKFMASK